jgi:hypothetical protein
LSFRRQTWATKGRAPSFSSIAYSAFAAAFRDPRDLSSQAQALQKTGDSECLERSEIGEHADRDLGVLVQRGRLDQSDRAVGGTAIFPFR